jgi:hypothetical protein
MIQANIRHDAVQPRIKAALESEAVKIFVCLQESFLINIAGVFRTARKIQRQTQNISIVPVHQFFKCGLVSLLGAFDQRTIIQAGAQLSCAVCGPDRNTVSRQRRR